MRRKCHPRPCGRGRPRPETKRTDFEASSWQSRKRNLYPRKKIWARGRTKRSGNGRTRRKWTTMEVGSRGGKIRRKSARRKLILLHELNSNDYLFPFSPFSVSESFRNSYSLPPDISTRKRYAASHLIDVISLSISFLTQVVDHTP